MNPQTLRTSLRGISAFQSLLSLPLMGRAVDLLDALCRRDIELAVEHYAGLFYDLRLSGFRTLGEWLAHHLRYDEAPYPLLVERGGDDPELTAAARQDVSVFSSLSSHDFRQDLVELNDLMEADYAPVIARLPAWHAVSPLSFEDLTAHCRANGAGLFARCRAFLWENGSLVPVTDPDCGDASEMIGYELQREEVIANTRALVEGRAVNNVLLYGDSGTGKSATVKSLLTVPGLDDLRLIEVNKDQLTGLPRLIRLLTGRRHKFILFIDDLAFDKDDKTYSALKTILEGGIEKRPSNVAVYATSNRRRLVRQTVSERAGDELDARETVDEKTALSERFGLRIAYLPLDKAAYLDLVDRLAAQEGVSMDREVLHREALKWEVCHPGRTPRTAQQFLASLRV